MVATCETSDSTLEKQAQISAIHEVEASLPDYVQKLQKKDPRLYRQVFDLWFGIEKLTGGTRSNRLELGRIFRELRSLYSDRNIGGNRPTSGHGTFEKECLQRGYKPRTVRDLISDYEACLAGKPSTAQKRKARQEKRMPTTAVGITKMQVHLAQLAIMLPLEVIERAYEVALELYDSNPSGAAKLRGAWERAKPYYKAVDTILADSEEGKSDVPKVPNWKEVPVATVN